MKPPEQVKAEFTRRWLERAEADWRLCHRLVADPEPYPEAIAFHCQQAAEKYLKAYLTWQQVESPKTHDIKRLLELVGSCDQTLAENLDDAASLTPYAVEYRYPGDYPPLTPDEVADAVGLVDRVREKLRTYLRDKLDL
jgi:HEPN domain-containing protein